MRINYILLLSKFFLLCVINEIIFIGSVTSVNLRNSERQQEFLDLFSPLRSMVINLAPRSQHERRSTHLILHRHHNTQTKDKQDHLNDATIRKQNELITTQSRKSPTIMDLQLNSTKRRYKRRYHPISCFSCASEEYEALYSRSDNLFSFGQPLQFDKSCDSKLELQNFAPAIRCDSTCISVLEPQYFGGILNEKRPYSYVRGCATDIFAVANAAALEEENEYNGPITKLAPVEIELLHRAEMCVFLPIQKLWPELFPKSNNPYSGSGGSTPELVKVCSCKKNGCNSHDALNSSASTNALNFTVFQIFHCCLLVGVVVLKFIMNF